MLEDIVNISGILPAKDVKAQTNEPEKIAIIGMAGFFAEWRNISEFWDGLCNGRNVMTDYPASRSEDVQLYIDSGKRICRAGYLPEIDCFDHEFFGISYNEACYTDPNQRIFMETVYHALENAGYAGESIRGTKTGVYVGQSADLTEQYGDYIKKSQPEQYHNISVPGNIKSVIAGRVSYWFDLRGPSMVIDTACSSTLVAIASACDGLRNRTIEMAIAGGIKLNIFPVQEGLDDEIGIRSSQDCLRSFDYAADGISSGEGGGVIILKSLEKALADGDEVYAVIRGYAINNDGNSMGITAPNPQAQEEVIIEAWENAGVRADEFDYIEAHGTGTQLGDPIEIEALNNAFGKQTAKKSFCAIGSIKTNIGHLDNVAGMAGILKIIAILQKKRLPASLYFERPNQKIDFIDSALYLNDNTRCMERKDHPFLCGINSFGLSGTNCHMVLEQYCETSKGTDHNPEQSTQSSKKLFVISAHTNEQMIILCNRYLDYLETNPQTELGRICYTLMVGRRHLAVRNAYVVDSIRQLTDELTKLRWCLLKKTAVFKKNSDNLDGIQLKMQKLCLKYMDDRCEEVLEQICQNYLNGGQPLASLLFSETEMKRLALPEYPFARTRCWIEMCGSDLLIDKCLVYTKHQLVYQTVYSDKTHWILNEHRVFGQPVLPGTAYIESIFIILDKMMTENQFIGTAATVLMSEQIHVEIGDLYYLKPLRLEENESRKVYTTLTNQDGGFNFAVGSWKEGEWIEHVVCRIKLTASALTDKKGTSFSGWGNSSKMVIERPINVEIGTHWQEIEKMIYYLSESEYVAHIKIPPHLKKEVVKNKVYAPALDRAMNVVNAIVGEGTYLPFSLKSLSLFKALPLEFYSHTIIRDIDKSIIRSDIVITDMSGTICCEIKDFIAKKIEKFTSQPDKELFHRIKWVRQNEFKTKKASLQYIFMINEDDYRFKQFIKATYTEAVCVYYRDNYVRLDALNYQIGSDEEDYHRLIKDILHYFADTRENYLIVHALARCFDTQEPDAATKIQQESGILSLLDLIKSIAGSSMAARTELIVVTNNSTIVNKNEKYVNLENAALFGAAKVIRQEFPMIKCRCIDMDEKTAMEYLARELLNGEDRPECVYRNNNRYVSSFVSVDPLNIKSFGNGIKKKGVYIVSGGNGDLGGIIADFILLKSGSVALLGMQAKAKKPIPPDCQYYQCDITQEEAVHTVINEVRNRQGEIRGVIHCAGVIKDTIMLLKDHDSVMAVLRPKMQGIRLLDKYTQEDKLDFFVAFSSVSAITGSPGQYDYAAANAYMDAFCSINNRINRKMISINWSAWKDAGMAYRLNLKAENHSFRPLETITALEAFERIICSDMSNIIVGVPNWSVLKQSINQPIVEDKESNHKVDMMTRTEKVVTQIWYEVLGNKNIEIDDNFVKLGGDSIMAVRLLTKLNSIYDNLDITIVFSCPTIRQMASFIDKYRLADDQSETEKVFSSSVIASEDAIQRSDNRSSDLDKLLEQLENREIQVSDAAAVLVHGKV